MPLGAVETTTSLISWSAKAGAVSIWRNSGGMSPFGTCCWPWARSEERRGGKECIYQCDCSSDVCSSDLDDDESYLLERESGRGQHLAQFGRNVALRHLLLAVGEIGRASWRERVYISV